MITFQPYHIDMILEGKKTATRRLWKKPRAKIGTVHQIKEGTWFNPSRGQILIKQVYKQKLLDISEKEAQEEGGYTKQEFLTKWFEINPKSERNPEVYVIKFEAIKPAPFQPSK